jgi:hypothetical protein
MSISQGWRWAGVVVAGVVAGVLATRPVITALVERAAVRAGPWRTHAATGSADANPYERAAIAVAGLYALSKDETVYYTAFTDSAGQPLDGRCDYRLIGRPLPSRWWSLTLYGADHYLVANAPGIHSRHATNLAFEPDGSYVVPVSAQAQPRNWLPAPAQGDFSITARLYNPDAAVLRDLAAVAMPQIERGACR